METEPELNNLTDLKSLLDNSIQNHENESGNHGKTHLNLSYLYQFLNKILENQGCLYQNLELLRSWVFWNKI